MEINTEMIKWKKWYVQIGGLFILRYVINMFNFGLKPIVKMAVFFLLVFIIGYHLFRFASWVNSKMLNREFK